MTTWACPLKLILTASADMRVRFWATISLVPSSLMINTQNRGRATHFVIFQVAVA